MTLAAFGAPVHGVCAHLRGREGVDVAAQLARSSVLDLTEPLAGAVLALHA
jgi:hypothetical protein